MGKPVPHPDLVPNRPTFLVPFSVRPGQKDPFGLTPPPSPDSIYFMATRFVLILSFLFTLGACPQALWAKRKATPTPTETDTETPTATPTPTIVPIIEQKLYTFDAMWGSKGSALDQLNGPEGIDVSS